MNRALFLEVINCTGVNMTDFIGYGKLCGAGAIIPILPNITDTAAEGLVYAQNGIHTWCFPNGPTAMVTKMI